MDRAGSDIEGATGSRIAEEDEGLTIQVNDDAGTKETLTSAATEAVQPVNNPTITVGETLTADTSAITAPMGDQRFLQII